MLPNAVQVVPTGEGCEGAALAPVAVGAHQAVGADPVPAILSAAHLPRAL